MDHRGITSNVCKIYGQQNHFTNKRVLIIAFNLKSTETSYVPLCVHPIRSTNNLKQTVITQNLKPNEIENNFPVPVGVEFPQFHCLQLSSNLMLELTNSEHRIKSLISFKLNALDDQMLLCPIITLTLKAVRSLPGQLVSYKFTSSL